MGTGSATVLTHCQVLAGGVDLSGQANQVTVSPSAVMLDATTYDSGGNSEFRPGLRSIQGTISTFLNETAAGTAMDVGTQGIVLTTTLTNDQASAGYSYDSISMQAGDEYAIGQLLRRNHSFQGTGRAFAGSLLLPKAARTAGGNGTGAELGAVSATQRVYASLHVLSVTGGNVVATVVSDDNGSFTSPTTRLTFTTRTTVGSETLSAAGAIADTHWRVTWTQTASTATFAVLVGIQ